MEKMRDIVIFVGAGLLIGAGWWHFYVQPHDEFRALVSDCMIHKGDMSRQSYESCVSETRPQR
jgi:hypothetical protein